MSVITSDQLPIITEERSPPASPRYDEADLIGTHQHLKSQVQIYALVV